jgi:hypothetical protein
MRRWTAARVGGTLLSLLVLGAADAQAQNLVQNPGFDGGLGSWTIAPGPHPIGWDAFVGNSAPGSATIDMTSPPSGTNAFVVYQCVPAAGATRYDVGGSFRYSGGSTAVPIGSVYVTFFSDPGCVTQLAGSSSFQMSGGSPPADTWLTVNYLGGLTTPPGTATVRVALLLFTFTGGSSFAWFDDINLTQSGLYYFTVAPCRVVDTRGGAPVGGPALVGQQTRTLPIAGNCSIPSTAKAVSVNLAVTQSTAAGNLRLFPAGQPVPTVSSINYGAGQTRANNAVVQLASNGAVDAFVGQPAGTTVELILDVNGYFE